MTDLGEKLKHYREQKEWTQPEMAKFIGIGYRTYQDIESTGVVSKVENLQKITQKTGITTQDISHEKESVNKKSEVENNESADSEINKKDHRIDDLIKIANKNADAVVSSTKSVERLTAMLESRSDAEREKNVSNLQNYAGLVAVIREIGIKAGYWKDQDTAEKALNRFVALHKL